MRSGTVARDPAGTLRVACAIPSPATVFVDSSPEQGGLWGRAYPSSPNADRAAATEFVATALRAVAVAEGDTGTVEVIGDGLLAGLARELLGARSGSGRPQAIIEATGSPTNVRSAIAGVESLGAVVLAAPVQAAAVDVAGYGDIHLRGLTVVGVPWATEPAAAPSELVDWALARLVRAPGDSPPPPALWYRCDA